MLPRTERGDQELRMYRHHQQKAGGSYIASMIDEFKIPHHRWDEGIDAYKVEFSVAVLPVMGPDIRRHCDWDEDSNVLSFDDQKACIRSTVQGLAYLHTLGGVHGGE